MHSSVYAMTRCLSVV